MTSILEINIADCCLAEISPNTQEVMGMLAQGSARQYFASQIGRLQRRYGKHNYAVDAHMIGLAKAVVVADIAAQKLPIDKRADLLSFIMERGMNMDLPIAKESGG